MKAILIALFLLGSVQASWAVEVLRPEDARTLVLKAADALAQEGKQKAYADFDDRQGPFWNGNLYVFVLNLQGVWESYPPKPDAVGISPLSLRDVDGKPFMRDMIEVAQIQGEGWVDYKWKNPVTNKLQPKTVYVKRVGDVIVAAGVYK